ncbi:MAG: hypothetical protein HYR91_08860 [Flavobacteriia bacterium]|nr:hypothetical protein [Flavobacteriia bacterium]
MKLSVLILFMTVVLQSMSQELVEKKHTGELNVGVRSTTSFFDNTNDGHPGMGTGGNFRIRLADRVNTDWFADYIFSMNKYLKRADYHIGWSVMFYPFNVQNKGFRPYVLAGHCFDYTVLTQLSNNTNTANRWSSAIQGGLGTHYYFTERLDFVFQAQYMMHLGTHLETVVTNSNVHFLKEKGTLAEGHLLLTVGINYNLGKLWKGK